jgi:hypothetical protein
MFTKDSRTENFLTQMGVEFKYTNSVAFADLSKNWSEHNLARPQPKRDEAIVEYAALMDSGSPAPAPVLHRTRSGLCDVLDGVQRLAAAELMGYTKLAAYIVECDSDEVVTAIRVLANARLQGRPEPPEWTRRRAVEVLVVEKGMSPSEVARMGGWRVADVEKIARVLAWGCKIRSIGGPQELSDAMTEAIAKHTTQETLAKEPGLIAEFLCVVKQAQFSASDAEPYLENFFKPISKASKAHQVYEERLEEFKQDEEVLVRVLGRRGTVMRHDVNLLRILKSAVTVLDELALSDEPLHYADEFFRLLSTIKDKLHHVSKNRKPVHTPTPADKWAKT